MAKHDSSEHTDSTPSGARGRSTIEFPYFDLDSAIEVATAVHEVGGTACEWNQLAAQMKQSPTGGGFRMRVMGARSFGILEYDRGQVELTDLGLHILDPKHSKQARTEAFLSVALFKALFDQLNGKMLPPHSAVERMVENLGVAPKQKDKARQVFMRSAKQAGFFDIDQDRLVLPPNGKKSADHHVHDEDRPTQDKPNTGIHAPKDEGRHPFIEGLLQKLPPPESEWAIEDRAKWLTTASNIFDLLYSSSNSTKSIRIETSN